MIMNKKTLKKLEYNKITELLAEQASSPGGKILCSHLAPMTSLAEITTAQEQTAAAFTRIVKKRTSLFQRCIHCGRFSDASGDWRSARL